MLWPVGYFSYGAERSQSPIIDLVHTTHSKVLYIYVESEDLILHVDYCHVCIFSNFDEDYLPLVDVPPLSFLGRCGIHTNFHTLLARDVAEEVACLRSKPLGTRVPSAAAGCAMDSSLRCLVSGMLLEYKDLILHAICCPACFPSIFDGNYSQLLDVPPFGCSGC